MRFATPLLPGLLIRRYKRFLADVRLDDGREVVAHCANPGAMTGLAEPGTRVWLAPNDNPARKLRFSWMLTEQAGAHFIGVDTSLPNRLVAEALGERRIAGLPPYDKVRAEVRLGHDARVDFLLEDASGARTWLEVKSVTLCRAPGLAEFPDTVSARAARHVGALAGAVAAGDRAVLLYVVQRTDCRAVGVAADIDPGYARALRGAPGVQVMAQLCAISPQEIALSGPCPVQAVAG